jgi:hypothetical protein
MQVAVSTSELHHVALAMPWLYRIPKTKNKGKRKLCRVRLYAMSGTEYALFLVFNVREMKKNKRLQITRGNTWNHIWIATLRSWMRSFVKQNVALKFTAYPRNWTTEHACFNPDSQKGTSINYWNPNIKTRYKQSVTRPTLICITSVTTQNYSQLSKPTVR